MLNILGELLRFGDWQFYREWWNATTIEQYWRLWNIPVHKWLARHVYFPCMRAGFSRSGAMFVTFMFSAMTGHP
jgi:diacylglycerol O-acyltransferase-1